MSIEWVRKHNGNELDGLHLHNRIAYTFVLMFQLKEKNTKYLSIFLCGVLQVQTRQKKL